MVPFTSPKYALTAFNCPHCGAYAEQVWAEVSYFMGGGYRDFSARIAICSHCHNYTLWHREHLIYPEGSSVPFANPDLGEDILADYNEAKSIVDKSPRGAAALLRLALQKLCLQLGEKGKDLNDDIGNLVKKGLPVKIQQALDLVRVVGNNAVHPGQIDLKDDRETASRLFELINLTAEVMITQPTQVEKMYASLPRTSKEQIAKRDKT